MMGRSHLPSLVLAALALSLAASPSSAAPRHTRYGSGPPAPAWAFGIEWGSWDNLADPDFVHPDAEPGRLLVRHDDVPLFGASAMRIWRRIAVRASLSRAEMDFGVFPVGGTRLRLGRAKCDQLQLSALYPVWSVRRSDDRRPGSAQWVLGWFTGPTVGWTRLSGLEPSAPGVQYAGIDRLSVGSGLQAGWEMWFGGPLWFDGPLANVALYVEGSFIGFGRELIEYRTTPASAFVSGSSRVAPATFKLGLALIRSRESGQPVSK